MTMGMLDQTDIKILNLLQQDARINLKELAGRVHRSPTPVQERIHKLQEQGYIRQYTAILDRVKIGRPLLAITQVTLSEHTKITLSDFEATMNQMPEVQACFHTSGTFDFILHIGVVNTQDYHDFLMDRLCSLPVVSQVQTSFVLKECKSYTPVPL
jgi:DNA-binding Lrp family transcriptional regulator